MSAPRDLDEELQKIRANVFCSYLPRYSVRYCEGFSKKIKNKKLVVKLPVEQLRQFILTNHSSQQLKNLWNGNGLKEDKQIRRRRTSKILYVFIKLIAFLE